MSDDALRRAGGRGGADPPPGGAPAGISRRAALRWGWLTGGCLLAGVVLVVSHRAEERELARILREAEPLWMLVAVLLQALTYPCAAAVWQRALARRGVAARLGPLVPLGLAKLFTDQALPSAGISGTLLFVRAMQRRGISASDAVAAVLASLLAFYLGFLVATLGALAILGRHGELTPLILAPAALLALLALGLPLALLVLRRQALRPEPGWLERWPGARTVSTALRSTPSGVLFAPGLLLETVALQLAIFLLDALTLGATLRAVAHPVAFPLVFASFVLASVVSSLAWVPGGLGTFEATCVALLHVHGASLEASLAATLLLRGLTFWLPMLPGLALARREAGRASARAERA